MKIAVKDLRPNPFREIGKYPIDEEKVKSLMLSIKETTFWDNVLCRRNGKVFEIAYGHHRLRALQGLGIKEVDIPVRKLTDAQMVRIMAEENLEWLTSPKVINQTVLSVKKFIEKELAKYEWGEFEKSELNKTIRFNNSQTLESAKGKKGIGQTTILKFLGGNWKQWMIQSAIRTDELAKEGKVDRKAVEVFDKVANADRFKSAVVEQDVPVEKQLEIAKTVQENIKKKETSAKGGITKNGKKIKSIAEDVRKKAGKPKTKKAKDSVVERIIKSLIDIEKQSRILADRLEGLRVDIKRLGIEQMTGLKPALAKFALYRLDKEIKTWKGLGYGKQNRRNRRIGSNVIG